MSDKDLVERIVVGKPFGMPDGPVPPGTIIKVSRNAAKLFHEQLKDVKVVKAQEAAAKALEESLANTEAEAAAPAPKAPGQGQAPKA
jgi:hypothetical protein